MSDAIEAVLIAMKAIFRKIFGAGAASAETGNADGLLLILCAALALYLANSPWSAQYFGFLHHHFGPFSVEEWINDGLMTIFFLLVGLEIKHEFLEGELADWRKRVLPSVAALGGVITPIAIYLFLNHSGGAAQRGAAIPAATDIAFAASAFSLAGAQAPRSLKVFLLALAILDDLAAIIIIAVFYASSLSIPMTLAALAVCGLLLALNLGGVRRLWPYLALGFVLWACVFSSGLHATLAGVLLALFIPQKGAPSPLHHLQHAIEPWVNRLIAPLFSLANAGVALAGLSFAYLAQPVALGIICGLFFGKQLGVFIFARIAVAIGAAERPEGATWLQLYAVAVLCGIGFTMSLFIGLLAFPQDSDFMTQTKIGVLAGSLVSGCLGAALLRLAPKQKAAFEDAA